MAPGGRTRRRLAAGVLAGLAGGALAGGAAAEPVTIRAKPITDFSITDPGEARRGRLAFLGGLVLDGPRGFGGLSGLLLEDGRLLAVTDAGQWLAARLVLDGARPTGLADAVMMPRLTRAGRPAADKQEGDGESLARQGDEVLVMVEQAAELLAYRAAGGTLDPAAPPRRVPIPERMRADARRLGMEALATLPSGGVIAFAEKPRRGLVPAYRLAGGRFSVKSHGPWSITGADALPGGDLVIVERRYEGGIELGLRVRRLGTDALAGSGPVDGPVLLEADFGDEIDNMEAIAAEVVDGTLVLTLLSDDNFNFLQRTLLLRFALTDPLPRPRPVPPGRRPGG